MKISRALTIGLCLALLAGCGQTADLRIEPPNPEPAQMDHLVSGLNEAGFSMYHQAVAVSGEDDVALSPASVGLAFGMLDVGAGGELASQLEDLFGLPGQGQGRWEAFHDFERLLTAEREVIRHEVDEIIIEVANGLFTDRTFEASPEFTDSVRQWFGAQSEQLNFRSDPEGARSHINEWIEERTHGLIPTMVPEGLFDESTTLALVNTLYFKASWWTPFSEHDTRDADFTALDGTVVTVDMMANTALNAAVWEGEGAVAVDLPYMNGDVSMLVIVPDQGKFSEVEASLSASLLDQITAELDHDLVALWMPRFDTDVSVNLQDVITGLGYDAIFSNPELAGIGPGLEVTGAAHQVRIVVDEKGTEAAAVTVISVVESEVPDPTREIRIDRPFIYVIRDHSTGAILFIGRVLDPS